jgi:hypothetical protein
LGHNIGEKFELTPGKFHILSFNCFRRRLPGYETTGPGPLKVKAAYLSIDIANFTA